MKRQLMFEDRLKGESITRSSMMDFNRPCNVAREAYEALNIGPFTNEVWKEIRTGSVDKIYNKYINSILNQFRLAGITHSVIIDNALADAEVPFRKLRAAVSALKSTRPISDPALLLTDVEFKNGKFGVFDMEPILERHCRVYIENETELKAYSLLKTIAAKYQEFSALMKSTGYRSFNPVRTPVEELRNFLKGEEGNLEVDIAHLKASISFGQRSREHADHQREYQRELRAAKPMPRPAEYIVVDTSQKFS